jgi:hypothetical protein
VVWVECCGFSIGKISIQRGSLDRGRHTVIDLFEGMISKSGICRGRAMVICCSLKLQKPKTHANRRQGPTL